MKTNLLTAVSIAVLSAALSTANAADFNYNYIEGSFQDIDLNGVDSEAVNFSGSFEIAPSLNIIAGYSNGEITTPRGFRDIDFDSMSLGLGYHAPIGDNTDLTANLKVINQDMDFIGDDTGYGVGVGIRHQVSDVVEIGTRIDYADVYDADDTTFQVNSRFFLNDATSLGLSFSTSAEEVDVLSAGVRFNF